MIRPTQVCRRPHGARRAPQQPTCASRLRQTCVPCDLCSAVRRIGGAGSHGLLAPYICDDALGAVILPRDDALRIDLRVHPHRASVSHYHAAPRVDRSRPLVPCRGVDATISDGQRLGRVFSRALSMTAAALRHVCGHTPIFAVERCCRRPGGLCRDRYRQHETGNGQKCLRLSRQIFPPLLSR